MRALERDAAYYFVGKACAALGVLLAIPLSTRALTTPDFAEYALWSAGALWSSTAAVGWLQTGVQRFHRERRLGDRFADYQRTVELALRIGALASALAIMLAAALLSHLPCAAVLAIGALAGTSSLYLGRQALAQADLAAKRVVAGDVARGLALPLVLVAMLLCGVGSIASVTLAQALGLLAAVVLLTRGAPTIVSGRARIAELRGLARYGLPLGLWLVITLANTQIGRVALEAHDMLGALAGYAAYHDIVIKAGTLVLMPLVYAVHGHVMAAWAEGDRAGVHRSLRRASRLQAALGVALVIGFSIAAPLMSRVLFQVPPSDESPIAVVAALTGGVVLANLGLLAHKGLEIGQRTATMVLLAVIVLALDGALCVIFVPSLGGLGAALAYLLSQLCYAVLAHVLSRRELARLTARSA